MTDSVDRNGSRGEAAKPVSDWALRYLDLGWTPLPLRPRDKRPLVPWEAFQIRRPTRSEVAQWFEHRSDTNVGVVTGRISDLVVLDVDAAHDGEGSLQALEQQYGKLCRTVEAHTGGGGRHLYFRYPAQAVRNRAAIAAGLDVRADGGYIVAPPSVHPSGRSYMWVEGRDPWSTEVAPLPEWLLEIITGGRRAGRGYPLSHWRELVRQGVGEGERNTTIASLTGHLLWHEVDPAIVLDLLLCWNAVRCRPPLSDDEVARTVESIIRTHERHRQMPDE